MPNSHPSLPLDLLFPRLEAAGFSLNTARRLRVWRVLNAEGGRFVGDMEGLKFLLCPLLARTPQEQQRFYMIFEQFWAECVMEWEEWPETEGVAVAGHMSNGDSRPTPDVRKKWLKYWGWVLAVVVLALGAYFVKKIYFTEKIRSPKALFGWETRRFSRAQGLLTGDTIDFINSSEYFDSTKVLWEVKEKETGKVLHEDSSTNTTWVAPEAGKNVSITLKVLAKSHPSLPKDTSLWHDSLSSTYQVDHIIRCTNAPKAGAIVTNTSTYIAGKPYVFEIEVEKGCYAEWDFNSQRIVGPDTVINDITPKDLEGNRVNYIFDRDGDHYIIVRIYRKNQKDYCFTEVSKTITVGSNKPFLRLANLKYDYPRQILQVSWLGWLIVFLPLLPALWFFYRWWKKRKESQAEKTDAELAAEYPIVDGAPYYIPYLPQEEKISVPREFFRIAEILRRREDAERREFDAQISVKATIAAGGFPTWRDLAKTRPAEYLFLIKRPDERDQQFRLFERLSNFMTRRDAPITTYFHDGRFDRFWTGSEEPSIDLNQLNRQFPQHRLIVLGDGHDLVHPAPNGSPVLLRDVVQFLIRWPRRLLLTPEAVSGWSYQEGLLHQVFPIFSADTDGILQGLEMLDRVEEHQPGSFEKWQEEQQYRRPETSHRYRNVHDVEALKRMLAHDDDLWRWCQALAVCAQPDWSLTIAIGRSIGVDVTHDRLLALTRVDWLRRNESDDYLRLELLKTLNADDEKAARYAVAVELEQVEEQVKNGFAATEWAANLAVQRFALDPREKSHKESIRHLQKLGLLSGGQLAELEWIIEKENLVAGGNGRLKRYLDLKEEKPFVTWEFETAVYLLVLTFMLSIMAYGFDLQRHLPPLDHNTVTTWKSIKNLDNQAITFNNQAVEIGQRIGKEKSYTRWLGYVEDSQQADTLWGQAIALRRPDYYALADSNRYAQRFNKAAQLLNFYLSDSIPSNEFRNDSIALSTAASSFFEMVNASYWQTNDPRRTDAQHAMGLCYFYLGDTAVARKAYQLILGSNPGYFDTLSMAMNLQILLNQNRFTVKPPKLNRPMALEIIDNTIENKHLRNIRKLTYGGDNAEAYWSPDGKWLTFQSNNPKWGLKCDQIFVMQVNKATIDSTYRPLRISTGNGRTTCSYFMPDGQHILYASTHEGGAPCPNTPELSAGGKYLWPIFDTYDIYIANLKGEITRRLTNRLGYDAEAVVSPKGDKILFTSDRSGDLELWTMNLDGSGLKQITNELGYDGGGFFSPDGSKIVFRATRPKKDEEIKEYREYLSQNLVIPADMEIFTCNSDGSNLRQVTYLGKNNWSPFFHPSGKKIIFSSNHNSKKGYDFQLYIVNLDGSELEQITTESIFNSFPMFSPNGTKIAFSSNRNNGGTRDTNIFVADWVE